MCYLKIQPNSCVVWPCRKHKTKKLEYTVCPPATLQVAQFQNGIDALPAAYDFRSAAYHISQTPDSGHYRTFGATAPAGEPDEGFALTLHAQLMQGAVHSALYVQNDETLAARAKLADVQEVMRTWYIAFYTRSQ